MRRTVVATRRPAGGRSRINRRVRRGAGEDRVVGAEQTLRRVARSYGRPGGFAGAAGLYRSMLTEGEELRTLAQAAPLQIPVTAIGSRNGRPRSCSRSDSSTHSPADRGCLAS